MADQLLQDLEKKMNKTMDALNKEFQGLRTGRASASLLENIQVDAYGSSMPLPQVGTINVPEARMITVQVWDKGMVANVEKAVREAGLGLNPASEGQLIRVPMPELSEERRIELTKIARKYAETARVSIRNIRRDGTDHLKTMEKDGDISEDEHHRLSHRVQELTDQFIKKIENQLETKETDILKV